MTQQMALGDLPNYSWPIHITMILKATNYNETHFDSYSFSFSIHLPSFIEIEQS